MLNKDDLYLCFAAPPQNNIHPKEIKAAKHVGSLGNPKMKPTGCGNIEIKTKKSQEGGSSLNNKP